MSAGAIIGIIMVILIIIAAVVLAWLYMRFDGTYMISSGAAPVVTTVMKIKCIEPETKVEVAIPDEKVRMEAEKWLSDLQAKPLISKYMAQVVDALGKVVAEAVYLKIARGNVTNATLGDAAKSESTLFIDKILYNQTLFAFPQEVFRDGFDWKIKIVGATLPTGISKELI